MEARTIAVLFMAFMLGTLAYTHWVLSNGTEEEKRKLDNLLVPFCIIFVIFYFVYGFASGQL